MKDFVEESELERLSRDIHYLYCTQYVKDHGEPYWTNGDYSKLDERTKEYDRNIARFILEDRGRFVEEMAKKVEGMRGCVSFNDRDSSLSAVATLLRDSIGG